jgi:hypothetical protein
VRLEALAQDRIPRKLAAELDYQAIKPSIGPGAVPNEVGLQDSHFGVTNRYREFARQTRGSGSVCGTQRAQR